MNGQTCSNGYVERPEHDQMNDDGRTIRTAMREVNLSCIFISSARLNDKENSPNPLAEPVATGFLHSNISKSSSRESTRSVVVLPEPAGPVRTRRRYIQQPIHEQTIRIREKKDFGQR